tara:strand:- start:6439 stop:7152 length:714 start_codon:yes stop_codon:yes gene_type:complete
MKTLGKIINTVAKGISKYSKEISALVAARSGNEKANRLKIIGQIGTAIAMPWATRDIYEGIDNLEKTSTSYFAKNDSKKFKIGIKDIFKETIKNIAKNSNANNFITDCFGKGTDPFRTMEYSVEDQIKDSEKSPKEPIGTAKKDDMNIIELFLNAQEQNHEDNKITQVAELGTFRPYVSKFIGENNNLNFAESDSLIKNGFSYATPTASAMMYDGVISNDSSSIYDQVLKQYQNIED